LRVPATSKHAAMRRPLFVALFLVGCAQHQPPDEALSAELHRATAATLVAMAMPDERRPAGRALDDQVRLLACRLDAAQAAAVRAGRVARPAVVAEYRETLKRRNARQSTALAPELLAFLVERADAWSVEQTLLAAALLAQYQEEATLQPPPPELAR
jgi:hypothetical protein